MSLCENEQSREVIHERSKVREVIELYIAGVSHGAIDSLRQAFHPKSFMFGYLGQDLFITPIAALYDYVADTTPPAQDGAAGEEVICTIASISVSGNAAAVEMAISSYHGHHFVDYFQLLKVDGRWWIVSRLFHADSQS